MNRDLAYIIGALLIPLSSHGSPVTVTNVIRVSNGTASSYEIAHSRNPDCDPRTSACVEKVAMRNALEDAKMEAWAECVELSGEIVSAQVSPHCHTSPVDTYEGPFVSRCYVTLASRCQH
jgi:adenine-specific DNA glycosylase